jgi:hypothetical protein
VTETLTMQELADEAAALDALVALDQGEWTDAHEALEQELAGKLAAKGDSYGDWLADRTARAALLKAEEQRLARRRKAIEGQVERVKRYAAHALDRMGRTTIEGERWTVALAKNPPRVVLDATVVPELLPPGFQRVVPAKVEVDLVAVKEALKLGDLLDWARLETTYSVRVR